MKIISSVLLCVLGTAMFYGCSSSSSPGAAASVTDLWPMKVGNTWTYHQQEFDAAGTQTSEKTLVWTVSGQVDSLGYKVFLFDAQDGPEALTFVGDKLCIFDIPPAPLLRYPLAPGGVFIARDTTFTDGSGTTVEKFYTVFEGDGFPIDLGFQKAYCAKFRFVSINGPIAHPDTTLESILYFAPKTGLAREEDYGHTGNNTSFLHTLWMLTSYKVN